MVRVGLSGGIGSGKSTVATRLAGRGATVIDADAIARDVLVPDGPGLAAVVEEFGPGVLDAHGALDRAALAAVVFADPERRAALNAIVHPLVTARTAALLASASGGAASARVVVHDVPLLVENGLAPSYALVVVVTAPVEVRLARLVAQRGLTEVDARARIAAQASDEQRAEVADVLLDNTGTRAELDARVDRLWEQRIAPFAANLAAGRPASLRSPLPGAYDPRWPATAGRWAARLRATGGADVRRVDHVGSTAVPGLLAQDVVDIQVVLARLDSDVLARLAPGFAEVGLVQDTTRGEPDPSPPAWRTAFFASADPGRRAHVQVRQVGEPGWRFALLVRDWLRACPEARAAYVARAKGSWLAQALVRAEAWAAATGWSPSDE